MNAQLERAACAALILFAFPLTANAKPIAFAQGTTVMAEYGAGTMTEIQAFYAPTFRYSLTDGVKDGFLINPRVIDARTEITTQLLSNLGYAAITHQAGKRIAWRAWG